MGQITSKIVTRQRLSGGSLLVIAELTMSNSYATGGDDLPTNANLGLGTGANALHAIFLAGLRGNVGYLLAVDFPNRKIRAYLTGAAAGSALDEANGQDLSSFAIRALILGDGPGL